MKNQNCMLQEVHGVIDSTNTTRDIWKSLLIRIVEQSYDFLQNSEETDKKTIQFVSGIASTINNALSNAGGEGVKA